MRDRLIRTAVAAQLCALLAGCSSAPPAPSGWQPAPGASPGTQWSTGSGDAEQTYAYKRAAFSGTLQELASQQAVNVVLEHPGSHFDSSDTYAPCPGIAALATFSLGKDRVLIQGFSLENGQATYVTYTRPRNAEMGDAVRAALDKALCG